MERLPDECVLRLALNLTPTDLGRLCRTARRFRRIGRDPQLWRRLCRQRGIAPTSGADDGDVDWHALFVHAACTDHWWSHLGVRTTYALGVPVSALAVDSDAACAYAGLATGQLLRVPLSPARGDADAHGSAPAPSIVVVARAHVAAIADVAIAGDMLLTAGFDGWVHMFTRAQDPTKATAPLHVLGALASPNNSPNSAVSTVGRQGPRHVVGGRMDGALVVWDVATGGLVQWLPGAHTGYVSAMLVLNSTTLLTGGADGRIRRWRWTPATATPAPGAVPSPWTDAASASSGRGAPVPAAVLAHPHQAWTATPDGRDMYTLLDVLEPRHTSTVSCLRHVADAVASASYDGTVVLWDRVTGMPLQQLLTHSDHVNGVALSDRWQLVTGAEDGRMLLWNRRTCALVRTFFALPASVDCLALTGNDLVAGASDGTFVHFSFEPEAGLSF